MRKKNWFITVFITVLSKFVCSLRKITMGSHILAHVSIECLDDRDPKLKIISELNLDSYEYIPVAYTTMHCMI